MDLFNNILYYTPDYQSSTPAGFEPALGIPTHLAGVRLNRSAKVSDTNLV